MLNFCQVSRRSHVLHEVRQSTIELAGMRGYVDDEILAIDFAQMRSVLMTSQKAEVGRNSKEDFQEM